MWRSCSEADRLAVEPPLTSISDLRPTHDLSQRLADLRKIRTDVDRLRGCSPMRQISRGKSRAACDLKSINHKTTQRNFFSPNDWESQADLDRHRTAKAYTTIYQPQVMPLVEREGHPSELVSGG